ncbi:MAG: replication initiation protein, partial [Romboutsia sp.]|nr:replication initiation protein [Romboutsia sp.]
MNKNKKELKKHIATIHCANTLSLLQRKISNALLYNAYPNLLTQEEHELSIKQLCNLIGYSGNNHSAIKIAVKGLIVTLIEWNVIDELGEEDWTASALLASVRLKGSRCIYAYSPRMKELLFSPKIYGKVNLIVQSRFKSSYGLALYENCIRYQGLPQTRWFEYNLFRKLMGVPDDKYNVFRDFNRRVLSKAVDEVNTYSDLQIDVEIQRKGRAVSAIRFILRERPKMKSFSAKAVGTKDGINFNSDQGLLFNKLHSIFGISKSQVKEILNNYPHDYITEKIDLIKGQKKYIDGNVINLAGYLISALKNNYQVKKSSCLAIHDLQVKNESKENTQRLENIKISEYKSYERNVINKYISNLSEKEKS